MTDYLPSFSDQEGNIWNVLQMNWCVDFGGRQCQIECQMENGGDMKTFVIYGLDGDFRQWSKDECCDSQPEKGLFYKKVMEMFKAFDTTGDVK